MARANEGATVTLGLTDAVRDAGDTLGTVTITGLSNDLSNFNGGSYTASTGTWSGTAAQFDALTFKAGEDGVQHLTPSRRRRAGLEAAARPRTTR